MGFTEAIQDGFSKYATFSGRSSRSAYWWWTLFAIIIYVIAYIISAAINSVIPYILVILAFIIPGLAVAVRRLHDTGKSGWWILIGLIPFGGIVLLVFYCMPSEGPNQYGQAPDTAPAMA